MSRAMQTWIIVGALFISVATLVYFFRPSDQPTTARAVVAENTSSADVTATEREQAPAELSSPVASTASTEEIEQVEDVTLVFRRAGSTRKLVAYRTPATSKAEDGTCSAPYVARERISNVTYAYGFVIDKFYAWNEKEGQQEYMPFESDLPRAFQGALHDIVRQGRTVTVTKQRCGMGQVATLVAVEA